MGRALIGLVLCVVLVLTGGVVWLGFSDLKPTPQPVQQVLPDAGFPR